MLAQASVPQAVLALNHLGSWESAPSSDSGHAEGPFAVHEGHDEVEEGAGHERAHRKLRWTSHRC